VALELRQLRYFVAVAEELNFTRAAQRLLMTQQPLSAAIRQLESDLGVQLFERTTRKVELTRAGEALLGEARELLRRADGAAERARRAASGSTTLCVGVNSAAYGDVAAAILEAYRARHADVQLEVRTYEVTAPAAGLADGSVDVAVVREPVVAPAVRTAVIGEEPRVFVISTSNPLATSDELSVAETFAVPWIAARRATDGCDPDRWRDFWLVNPRADGSTPIVGAEAGTIDEWREYAAAGVGISLCPASAERYYARPGLAFVGARDAEPSKLAVAWREAEEERAREFVELALRVGDRAAT